MEWTQTGINENTFPDGTTGAHLPSVGGRRLAGADELVQPARVDVTQEAARRLQLGGRALRHQLLHVVRQPAEHGHVVARLGHAHSGRADRRRVRQPQVRVGQRQHVAEPAASADTQRQRPGQGRRLPTRPGQGQRWGSVLKNMISGGK